jgi:Asp/Glu/hydantoin racemase
VTERILVINPNSTQAVTDGISESVDPLRLASGPRIDCATLVAGPPAVETQADVESVVQPLCRLIRREPASAYVIACYSDPGLFAAREATETPVMGISECSMLTALTLGERFGVIAILPGSVDRQRRYVRMMGLGGRYAGSRPVGLGVLELADDGNVLERMIATGRWLQEQRDADVLVMGCAGMARFRRHLEQALGLPVVEPCQAAVTMALGAIRFGWRR